MASKLVTIATFSESVDAYASRARLERSGIPAVVFDQLSSGGAKLQVDESLCPRARELLLAEVSRDDDLSGYWRCVECQVVIDPGFDVCWSCLRPRRDVDDKTFRPTWALVSEPHDDDEDAPIIPLAFHRPTGASADDTLSAVSSSPMDVQGLQLAEPDSDERIVRAWRASVLGLLLFPPLLNIYSMYLLVRVGITLPALSRRSMRQFYAALVINILSSLALGLYQWLGLFG